MVATYKVVGFKIHKLSVLMKIFADVKFATDGIMCLTIHCL